MVNICGNLVTFYLVVLTLGLRSSNSEISHIQVLGHVTCCHLNLNTSSDKEICLQTLKIDIFNS